MSCQLLGHIGIVPDPAMTEIGLAVRVVRRGHDLIFTNPTASYWDRMQAIIGLTEPTERDLLVYRVECSCVRVLELVSA